MPCLSMLFAVLSSRFQNSKNLKNVAIFLDTGLTAEVSIGTIDSDRNISAVLPKNAYYPGYNHVNP